MTVRVMKWICTCSYIRILHVKARIFMTPSILEVRAAGSPYSRTQSLALGSPKTFGMIDGLNHLDHWRFMARPSLQIQETGKKPENHPSQPLPFPLSFPPSCSQPISASWVSLMDPDDLTPAASPSFLFSSSFLAEGVVFAQTDLSTRLKSPDCFPK